jgi:hypothetical protein
MNYCAIPVIEFDLNAVREFNRLRKTYPRLGKGQFATPNTLAIEIINYSKTLLSPDQKIRFLDPAIGTGSFYSALLQSFSIESKVPLGMRSIRLGRWE